MKIEKKKNEVGVGEGVVAEEHDPPEHGGRPGQQLCDGGTTPTCFRLAFFRFERFAEIRAYDTWIK